jgi:HEAT repeat protein
MVGAAISIDELVTALQDVSTPLPARYLYRLSDLEGSDLVRIKTVFPDLPVWRRKALMEDVEELGDSDDLLSFETLARLGIQDEDTEVRLPAVRILWAFDSPGLANIFLAILENDTNAGVRGAAAEGLGQFVYAGAVDELPQKLAAKIEAGLLSAYQSDSAILVKRKALMSLGYSENPKIPPLILKAYASNDREWVVSALAAMGHSADAQWSPKILASLGHSHPQIRAEAARAAGEVELNKAVPRLLELLEDDDDFDTRQAVIWSLAQIGGEGVRDSLETALENTTDDEEHDYIEEALDLLSFTEESTLFPVLDLDEDDDLDEYSNDDPEEG